VLQGEYQAKKYLDQFGLLMRATYCIYYLLPVQGSNTNWYKNVQKNPHVKISISGQQIITGKARAITDTNKVKEVVEKFRSKYGVSDVKKYYTKFDVYVELLLKQPT
jgi:hypothetical protein